MGNLNHILLNFKYFIKTLEERETFYDKGIYTGFSGLMYAILNNQKDLITKLALYEYQLQTKVHQLVKYN